MALPPRAGAHAVHRNSATALTPKGWLGSKVSTKMVSSSGISFCPEDMIAIQVALQGLAFFVITHLFADRITQGLGHPAFDLSEAVSGLDNHTRIKPPLPTYPP